jgi:hypothetical protein
MKKDYTLPDFDLIATLSCDVITASDPDGAEIGTSMSLNGDIQPDGWT